MSTTIISADVIGNGSQILTSDDSLTLVTAGTIVASTDYNAFTDITASGVVLDIRGTVIGDFSAISMAETSSPNGSNSVTIAAGGTVSSRVSSAIFIGGDHSNIVNYGTVFSTQSNGVNFGDADGVRTLENHGSIFSEGLGEFDNAVRFEGGVADLSTQTIVRNTGAIYSRSDLTSAIHLQDAATVINSGSIYGPKTAITSKSNGTLDIKNSGYIHGLIDFTSRADTIVNTDTGHIDGDLLLDDGQDSVLNQGLITGDVDLDEGGGQFTNTATGVIDGNVVGHGAAVVNSGQISGFLDVESGSIFNSGSIHSVKNDAITISDTRLENTGNIVGKIDGVVGEDLANIVNYGLIQGDLTGIRAENNVGSSLTNYGSIVGGPASGGYGLVLASSQTNVNFGSITGTTGVSVYTFTESTDFINNGTITGVGGDAYLGDSNDSDRLVNAGAFFGDVRLQAGNDRIVNFGIINGDIELGNDQDTYVGTSGFVDGTVFGGNGNDTLIGGKDNDVLDGGVDDDVLNGGAGDDTLWGESHDDVLRGGTGDDSLNGGSEEDSLFGGTGDDTISGGTGNDTLWGGAGDDVLFGGSNKDFVAGNSGDDTMTGGPNSDTLSGGGGDDSLEGGNGDDLIVTSQGNDTVSGGGGHDVIKGEDGNDILNGDANNDTMSGGAGDDYLLGGAGNDRLLGAAGNDTLEGGAGIESLDGGAGEDVFVFSNVSDTEIGPTRDVIYGFDRDDDLLDVTGIGSLEFGAGAAVGGGHGSVWVQTAGTGGVHTLVRIDADGDGNEDGQFLLADVVDITADDFLLG